MGYEHNNCNKIDTLRFVWTPTNNENHQHEKKNVSFKSSSNKQNIKAAKETFEDVNRYFIGTD